LLVAVRVAIPLAVLAASPTRLPALPRIRFGVSGGCARRAEPWTGDACAYYSTARALVSAWRSLGAAGLALLALAVAAGLALSLLANAATVVATAYAGLHASGRRSVALLAGALFALWPLLVAGIAGTRSWGNGTWEVEAGLHLYTEPLSTALVAVAVALVL